MQDSRRRMLAQQAEADAQEQAHLRVRFEEFQDVAAYVHGSIEVMLGFEICMLMKWF